MKSLAMVVGMLLAMAGCSGTSADEPSADFVVAVGDERFVVRSTHPETIAQLRDAAAGRRSGFPIGPLRSGNGGFNSPWTWHLDPAETRFTEVAIEVCDGEPSYVEAHQPDFPTYCPWGARIVSER
jgi:hypothetical protein